MALGPWLQARRLGGPWYVVQEARWFPEAGFAKYTLYRRGVEHAVFAACGARIPVAIDRYAGGAVSYTPGGVARERDLNGAPLQRPSLMPIAEIEAVARRQPPFHGGWERLPLDAAAEVPRVDLR